MNIIVGLTIWIIIQVVLGYRMIKTKPQKSIISRYPKKIVLYSQLPFGSSWKKNINKKDLLAMEAFQKNIQIWYLSLVIPVVVFFLLVYLGYS